MKLGEIIRYNNRNLAIVIGNGINRFNADENDHSWETILRSLAQFYLPNFHGDIPQGIAYTEFFDFLISGASLFGKKETELQKEFCKHVETLNQREHHTKIVNWAKFHGIPILTTNFDTTLSANIAPHLSRSSRRKFVYRYPWESYYSSTKRIVKSEFFRPSNQFGVWHINGMSKYHASIRLALSHYMGSVQRAREWMYRGTNRLFSSENAVNKWRGRDSWLDAIFMNDLLFIGISLDEVEIFLRWLLVERSRFYRKFPSLRKRAWYVTTDELSNSGKKLFFQSVGVELLFEHSFESIYLNDGWEV